MKITGKITKHLSWEEVWHSFTAKRLGIKNWTKNDVILHNIIDTANYIFKPVRKHFNVPIKINSWYRSKRLNKAIGGVKGSQHTKGQAVDLDDTLSRRYGVTNRDIFFFIKNNLKFDQLIWEYGNDDEPDWVHVSFATGKNRMQVLRSYRKKNKIKYENF